MYPLKFEKFLVKKIWGGRKFEKNLGMQLLDESSYGESWEVSLRKECISKVMNGKFAGKTLAELLEIYKDRLLGEEVWRNFSGEFPLLIKYLDINDKLSVQVHPDDEYAMKNENDRGKSECWYVMDASSDAKLIMGIKDEIDRESFKKKVEEKDFSDLFNVVSVKKGDFIDIRPGIVHATLKGSILICETQQNSDTTYRIYDFDRVVDGKARELHLEKAMDVINFDKIPEISEEEKRTKISLKGAIKQELTRGRYFNIDKLEIDEVFKDEINKNFKIYSILAGEGEIIHNEEIYKASIGDTFFIPAELEVVISGKLEILKSYL